MPRPVKETKKRKAEASPKDADDEDSPGKRKRMSSLETSFEPGDFTVHDSTTSRVNVIVGRGKKLQEFPSVMSSMEKHTTEEVLFAHKFLFGNKGSSAKKKEMLENLGEFSGYLKKVPKGYDQEKLEKEDEREEEKYSKKAFKMILAQVRMLCDFFDVIRVDESGNPLNKDDMIENLLDFLTQPHKDFLNVEYPDIVAKKATGATTKKSTNAPTTKATAAPTKKATVPLTKMKTVPKKADVRKSASKTSKPKAEPRMDPFSLIKKHTTGTEPSDEALRQWVKAYIVCFDMNRATTKHAIQTASEKFGIDLSGKKNTIKEMLADEM